MVPVLFCLFTLLCLWLLFTNLNLLSSFNIFLGIFFLYYFFGLADYLNGDYSLKYFNDQVVLRFSHDQLVLELVMVNTFVIGLMLATFVGEKRARAGQYTLPAEPKYLSMQIISYSLMCAGAIMYAYFIYHVYGGLSHMLHLDRYSLYLKKRGMGTLLIGLYVFYAGALVRVFYYILYRNKKQLFPVIPVLIVLLLFFIQYKNGDRSNILFFLLPLFLALLYKKPRITPYFLLTLPLIILALQLISVQRKLRQANSSENVVHFVLHNGQAMNISRNGEFPAPGMVDRMVCQNMNMVKLRYGGTFVDALLSMPPTWMVSKRPMLPAEWYASNFFPEDYKSGQGYGFSVLSEAIINFYYAGPILYGFLLGLLFLYVDKRITHTSFYALVIFCILQYYVFLIPRSGIAALLKPALSVVVITAGCIWTVSRLFKKRASS